MKALGGIREKEHTDRREGREGHLQRDFTSSEAGDEEDVESPPFDPIPWDPRALFPQLCNE